MTIDVKVLALINLIVQSLLFAVPVNVLIKAQTQFLLKQKCGLLAPLVLNPVATASDAVFRRMK